MNLPQMSTFDDSTEPYSWFKQMEQLLNFIKDETKRVQTALKYFKGNRSLFPSTLDPMPTTRKRCKQQFMKCFVDNEEDVLPAHRLSTFAITAKAVDKAVISKLRVLLRDTELEEAKAAQIMLAHLIMVSQLMGWGYFCGKAIAPSVGVW